MYYILIAAASLKLAYEIDTVGIRAYLALQFVLYVSLIFLLTGCDFAVEPGADPVQEARAEVAGYWAGVLAQGNETRLHLGLSGDLDGVYIDRGTAYYAVGSYDVSRGESGRVHVGLRFAAGVLGTADLVGLLVHRDSLYLSWHNENQYLMTRTNPFPRLQ